MTEGWKRLPLKDWLIKSWEIYEFSTISKLFTRYVFTFTTPNSNSTSLEDPHENQLRLMWFTL